MRTSPGRPVDGSPSTQHMVGDHIRSAARKTCLPRQQHSRLPHAVENLETTSGGLGKSPSCCYLVGESGSGQGTYEIWAHRPVETGDHAPHVARLCAWTSLPRRRFTFS
jgi:hypothetical protein